MSREIKLLRVVVVSPSDVKPERDALQEILDSVNRDSAHERGLHLDLSRWETDAYPGFHPEGPQGFIDDLLNLDDADIVIGIFWTRFGTTIANGQTGTEHELTTAIESWREKKRPQVMVYFNCASYSPKDSTETDQWSRVLKFKEDFPKEGLWWPYEGKDNFTKIVESHLRKLITKLGKSVGPLGELSRAENKSNLKYALIVLGTLLIPTALYTFHLEGLIPKKKLPPLILLGSSNVHSYLRTHMSRRTWNDIDPIWLDLASGDTQRTAYAAFANGSSNQREDLGFIAMSSGGTETLAKEFASDKDNKNNPDAKWFLKIVVARQPLSVFYRLDEASSSDVLKMLNVRPADRLPQELGGKASRLYHFVNITNLKDIIIRPKLEAKDHVTMYLTRGSSATKSLFMDAAAKDEKSQIEDWSAIDGVKDIPKDIEGFTENSSFIEILSQPQVSMKDSKDSFDTCKTLYTHNIEAAMICTGSAPSTTCDNTQLAEFVLIFKLIPAQRQGYKYKIANLSECRFARELDQAFLKTDKGKREKERMTIDCEINPDTPRDPKIEQIYTLDFDDGGLPDYLRCPQRLTSR